MTRREPARMPALRRDDRGVSAIEFGICLPVLVILTLWVFELINYALVREQLSQLALQVADNAARIGSQSTVQTQIDEKQINDLFVGSDLQAGRLGVIQNGRIILSSLETVPGAPTRQYIHWQRCYGSLAHPSSYGSQGDGKNDASVTGMGPADGSVKAMPGVPAMFVEIGYKYQPIISNIFSPPLDMQEIAAMLVRDNRDISDPGVNPVAGTAPSSC